MKKSIIKLIAIFVAISLSVFFFGCEKPVTEDEFNTLIAAHESLLNSFDDVTQIYEEKKLLSDGLMNSVYETVQLYVNDFEKKIPASQNAITREKYEALLADIESLTNSVAELKATAQSK